MRRSVFAALAGGLLAGCVSIEEAGQQATSSWVGRPADQFFLALGPPESSFPLTDGSTIYEWSAAHQSMTMPGASTSRGTIFGHSINVTTTQYSDLTFESECRARLVADKAGQITRIDIEKRPGVSFDAARCPALMKG